jgi:heme ABC exporter ATP-binding subunit CcmA
VARVSSSVVSLCSVVALVDRFPVLAGVDFDAAEGEVVLLRGANGAGKTSLLRVIAGLLPISQGTANVLGHDLRRNPRAVRRSVGFLGHHNHLYGDLTTKENVTFAVRATGAAMDSIESALERLGLTQLADVPADRLSAGQRRRTALAPLLARQPKLWLLDEPHAGLDVATRALLDDTIREVAANGGTVLLSSHEAGAAIADRAVVIEGGATGGGSADSGATGDALDIREAADVS